MTFRCTRICKSKKRDIHLRNEKITVHTSENLKFISTFYYSFISVAYVFFPLTDKPSPPSNLRIKEVNKDYIVVAWDAPETDGGAPITEYNVEKRDARKTNFLSAVKTDSSTMEAKITKLVEGNEYIFQVFAENAVGTSMPAILEEPTKARLPFGKFCFHKIICIN